MKSRTAVVGIVCVAALAVITGSVLLVGYVVAGASLLLMLAMLIRRAVSRRRTPQMRPSHARWVDVRDREAA